MTPKTGRIRKKKGDLKERGEESNNTRNMDE